MLDIRANDVLFGRGPICYKSPGNIAFRNLIQSYVASYSRCAPRSVKRRIVIKLISKAQKQGYRFLIRAQNNDMWCEAHPDLVKSKVGHALRDARNLVDNLCDKISNSKHTTRKDKRQETKLNEKQALPSFKIDVNDCRASPNMHHQLHGKRNDLKSIEIRKTHYLDTKDSYLCQVMQQPYFSKECDDECNAFNNRIELNPNSIVQTAAFHSQRLRYVKSFNYEF
jgi:hypothetical protein